MKTSTSAVAVVVGLSVACSVACAQCQAPFVVTDFALDEPSFSLVGSASIGSQGDLELTPNLSGQAGAAWWSASPATIRNGFFTQFTFVLDGAADGIAFVIQTDGTTTLGGGGSGLGYDGIPRSLAIEIDTFSFGGGIELPGVHASINTQGVNPNAAFGFDYLNWGPIPMNINDGQPHVAEIRYDGSNLSLLIDNVPITGIAVDMENLFGDSILDADGCAYIGLTGATGGAAARQSILNWSWNDQIPTPCATDLFFTGLGAQGWSIVGSTMFSGTEIHLTQAESGQAGAAWWSNTMRLRDGFEMAFDFRMDGVADGMAFVIQNAGLQALGTGGSGLGYGINGGPGIARSLAVEFDTFSFGPPGEASADHVAVHTQGFGENNPADSTALQITELGQDLNDGEVHSALIRYENGELQVHVDGVLELATSVDLDSINGQSILNDEGCAYIGFTGGTGAVAAVQAVLSLRFGSLDGGCESVNFTDFVDWSSPVTAGSRVEWEFAGSGTQPRYFWYLNGSRVEDDGAISGASTNRLVIDPIGPEHAGQWDYGLENDCSGIGTGFFLDVTVPCVGDYNRDEGVDGDDVIAFFADWDNGLIEADINGDEGVDGDDVIFFFSRWDNGC